MTQNTNKKIWFKAKLYGWGWYPATWQGWFITLLFVAVVVFCGQNLGPNPTENQTVFGFVLPIVISAIIFIYIAYKTGEKPRWRWGK